MKFDLFCSLHKHGKSYTAETDYYTIYNVLLADDSIANENVETVHSFVLVVNKKGQLTVLCIK